MKAQLSGTPGKMDWHRMDLPAVMRELATDSQSGLSEEEAARRLATHGRNELTGSGTRSPWAIIREQLTALMVIVLIVAAVVSALLGDYKDAIAIGAIVVLNAVLGFSQEYRAERAMAALKKLAVESVKVRRDGRVREMSAPLLVPGDIVLVGSGNFIAADSRILESAALQAQEAALTGESQPIRKTTEAIAGVDLPLGDRSNMLYKGTFITGGRGTAVVTETGMRTELGRIATLIHSVDPEPTPLQRRLGELGKGLAAAALFLVAVIFLLGWLRGEELRLLFLTAVSIGVAAVPEGLPAVVTIALTFGAQRMLKRRALIRRLAAVETLGSVTVICTDKTGTLTENRMTVTALQTPEESLVMPLDSGPVTGEGPGFSLLLAGAALCNDTLMPAAPNDPKIAADSSPALTGDPTETALVVAAGRLGLAKSELDRALPRVAEVPFSSGRKRMTTVHRMPAAGIAIPAGLAVVAGGSPYLACTKGAVDSLLEISGAVWVSGCAKPLSKALREQLTKQHEDLARSGMRVLGVAFRGLASVPDAGAIQEQDLIFAGMIGIIDPPRREVRAAVEKCKSAGIRPVMITGDHPLTARYIAAQTGIGNDGRVVTGPELDRMTAAGLERTVDSVQIYARVSPEHKLRIVTALQQRGEIVAMTGDGVNDAPALRKANIGVAMGIGGTDVAKEAADMVLLDDNFATIVAAVEEGRVIYDNVRKFIRYMLGTNSGEIWVMLAAPFFGMPLPLLPLQILWMNLMTDGLPALALGVEPAEKDTMTRPPYSPTQNIFARGLGWQVIRVGLLTGALSLGAGFWYWRAGDPNWQTLLFTTLTFAQMANIMAIRSERQSLFQIGVTSNLPLLGAVSLTVVLQLALVYVPPLQTIFRTRPLPPFDIALTIVLSSVVFAAVEIEKAIARRSSARTA
jgi:Ca2+-transporting ATPase